MALRKLSLAASLAFTVTATLVSAFGASVHPALPDVKRVYLLPMTSGLDQYLANRLTKVGRFEVVTDPLNADAVLTDRLGPAFEEKWIEMYPPPPKAESAAPVDEKAAAKLDPKAVDPKATPEKKRESTMIEDMSAAAPMSRISSFSRGRGNVFIVSRKTGSVVWSHYKMPKNARSKELDDTADDIVDRLHKDLNFKK